MIQTLLPFRYISAFLFILLAGLMTGGDLYGQDVRFSEPADTVGEGRSTVTLEVILLEEGPAAWDLVFQSNLSSATREDFTGDPGQTISFPEGAAAGSRRQITIRLNNDTAFEREKHATFILKSTAAGSPAVSVFRLVILDDDQPGVTFTELLADPSGDVNGDGTGGDEADRFIELYNGERTAVDLSGWTIAGGDGRIIHRFEEGDQIPSGSALLLFGGERWNGSFGGSRVLGIPSMRLDPLGDQLTLSDAGRTAIDRISYGPAGPQTGSWVRKIGGETVTAHTAASDGARWSPGRRTDGSWYSAAFTLQGEAGWRVISVPADNIPVSELLPERLLRSAEESRPEAFGSYYTEYDGERFLPPDDPGETVSPGSGMVVWYPGDLSADGSSPEPVTLDAARGAPPSGSLIVPLHADGNRWNLLGNPWPHAIQLDDIASRARGGDLESGVAQVWDGRLGSFVPLSVNGGTIEPWQGFFIRNGGATGFELPDPSEGNRAGGALEAEPERKIAFTLTGSPEPGGVLTDRAAVVTFGDGADHRWDFGDGEKLAPLSDNHVYIGIRGTREGEAVLKAQDSRPLEISGGLNLDLAVGARNFGGAMTLEWDLDHLPEEWEISLHDRVTGETVDLRSDDSHSFEFSGTSAETENRQPRLETIPPAEDEPPRFQLRISGQPQAAAPERTSESVKLNPNYPNPFSESTTISFELSEDSDVTLTIWNLLAQKVATLIDGPVEAGVHEEVWNAGNLPSTIYLIHLEVNGQVYNRRMALIK